MTQIDLKTQVAAAVAVRWDTFAERHPALADVIDATLLIENAADALANDAEYQEAMHAVRTAGVGIEMVVGVIDRYVVKLIARLV